MSKAVLISLTSSTGIVKVAQSSAFQTFFSAAFGCWDPGFAGAADLAGTLLITLKYLSNFNKFQSVQLHSYLSFIKKIYAYLLYRLHYRLHQILNSVILLTQSYFLCKILFLPSSTTKMQKQINELSLNIAFSLLHDYTQDQTRQLMLIHQRFARQFTNKKETQLHDWLLGQTKKINFQIANLLQGTKEAFDQVGFSFIFEFFARCYQLAEQNCKYLSQVLSQILKKKVEGPSQPPQLPIFHTLLTADKSQGGQDLKRCSQNITKDLEGLDYILNMLTYEDSKSYDQYKSQCDKILLQRQFLDNIKPSQASKEILETANMIESVVQNSDKVFQDSYMLKYIEFKSILNNLQKPETFINNFKEEMSNATKEKFKDGMNRTLKKCYEINQRQGKGLHESKSTQTDQIKGRTQQKLQNLLILEKKINEKLNLQLKSLRKNRSSVLQQEHIQKIIQLQQMKRKDLQSKYKILQIMYHQKCEEFITKQKTIIFQPKQNNKKQLVTSFIQTGNFQPNHTQSQAQTDNQFYYYFESTKISEYRIKIVQLEEEIKYLKYQFQQMQAVRTFRDNFKSKKQIYQTAVKSSRHIPDTAKSLHYLNEDDQFFDIKSQQKLPIPSSIQGISTKKKVTLQDLQLNTQKINGAISMIRKNKKKAQTMKSKPFFAFDEKVVDQIQEQPLKSQCELQKVFIKSILKLGSNHFKKEFGVQTDIVKSENTYDYIIQSRAGSSKIQKSKLNLRQRGQKGQNISKSYIRPSVSSAAKSSRQKQIASPVQSRKSNFVAIDELNQRNSTDKYTNGPQTSSSSFRMSKFVNTAKKTQAQNKNTVVARTSKWKETKVNTVGSEILHVNHTLNFNFLEPINSIKAAPGNILTKKQSGYESLKKSKAFGKIL